MIEEWLKLIQEPVLSQGISLVPEGVNETAWPIDCASSVIAALHGGGYAILGGDIYFKKPNKFIPAYENWYSNISPGEPWPAYTQRTHMKAEQYLLGLGKAADKWFTITAALNPNPDQLIT